MDKKAVINKIRKEVEKQLPLDLLNQIKFAGIFNRHENIYTLAYRLVDELSWCKVYCYERNNKVKLTCVVFQDAYVVPNIRINICDELLKDKAFVIDMLEQMKTLSAEFDKASEKAYGHIDNN